MFKMDAVKHATEMGGDKLLGSSHIDDLAWLIPAVFAGVIFFIIFAIICFYGIRRCELRVMACWYETCGCCRPPGGRESDDETIQLTAASNRERKGYKTNAPPSRDPYDFLL